MLFRSGESWCERSPVACDRTDAIARNTYVYFKITFAIANELDGAYNLCTNGVITPESVDELLGRAWIPAMPAELLERLLVRASRLGIGEIPPEVVAYLQ